MAVVKHLTPIAERDHGRPMKCKKLEQRRRLTGLLEACGKGDRAAFRRLYDLSVNFVFGVVRAILRDKDIAEEVAQEVYVSIWRRAGSFDTEKGNPLAWMAAIARNKAIDRLRAERARGFIYFSDNVPDIASETVPADIAADSIAVRQVLDDLRPEFRQALLLTYFQGYTHTELADVMNVPVGTAKSWVRRGLNALKEGLQ